MSLWRLADPSEQVNVELLEECVETLRREGRELRAAELLGRALRSRPEEEEIQASLAFLLVSRLDFDRAAPLLQRLVSSPKYGLRAELLLGERAEREGHFATALQHYERVLAKDVTQSQALNRARRLRERLGSAAVPTAGATVVQPEGVATRGRYELVRELGRGGAAAVYLAVDRHLHRHVALKVYHPQVMRDDGPRQLAREAALPGRVDHPGIVRVFDVDPKLGALAMELISGGSLKDRLKREPMTTGVALRTIQSICEPLAALHELGIVHRDIKPGNIMLRGGSGGRPIPVLSDLGVALLPGEQHVPGVGTPAFMAPEQRTERFIDERADVYSVGVMLAAMLGGYPGPKGKIEDLLDRCLGESPGVRPRDARELGQMVAAIAESEVRNHEFREDLALVPELASDS